MPDPVFLFEIEGKTYLMLSSLEVERGRTEARVDEIVPLEAYAEQSKRESLPAAALFLREQGITHLFVPDGFPLFYGRELERVCKVETVQNSLYDARMKKNDFEIQEIEKAQGAVERAVDLGLQYLRACEIDGERLLHPEQQTAVTSADLRKVIDDSLYASGYLGHESIVSCGPQSADPHQKGSGPLVPYQPMVLDIFPQSRDTLYFSDQTRTVFKGAPSEKLKRMYAAVLGAQERAILAIRPGTPVRELETLVRDYFEQQGYTTTRSSSPVAGFIHSLGHGVGVEIHERPHVSERSDEILEAGNVITIEPGLYYHEESDVWPRGGIRIEDIILVTERGYRNLTRFPKKFEEVVL